MTDTTAHTKTSWCNIFQINYQWWLQRHEGSRGSGFYQDGVSSTAMVKTIGKTWGKKEFKRNTLKCQICKHFLLKVYMRSHQIVTFWKLQMSELCHTDCCTLQQRRPDKVTHSVFARYQSSLCFAFSVFYAEKVGNLWCFMLHFPLFSISRRLFDAKPVGLWTPISESGSILSFKTSTST